MQNILIKNISIFKILILIFIILFGVYLCFTSGYGADEDTLPMIGVFVTRLTNGSFLSSRFTSYPIPEIGIGFLAYHFGSWASNIASFLFVFFGLIFFFFCFEKKINKENLVIFLLLTLTNSVIYFHNLESVDHSWGFLFFSIGLLSFAKKQSELAIIFFALSIGSRPNYGLFVIVSAIFYDPEYKIDIKKRIIILILSIFIGALFYLSIWYHNAFNFNWITAARPINQGWYGLIARFSIKTITGIGIIQCIYIIFIFFIFKNNINIHKSKFKNQRFLIILATSNLLLFLWIPAEASYCLLFFIIFLYLVFNYLKKLFVYYLILINLLTWFFDISIIKINYKYQDICKPTEALSANFRISIINGRYIDYQNSRDKIKCWIDVNSEYGKKILAGKAIKSY